MKNPFSCYILFPRLTAEAVRVLFPFHFRLFIETLFEEFVFFLPFLFALKAVYNVVLAGIRAVTEV